MNEILQAHSVNETRYFLMVTPCPACGKGPWQTGQASASPAGDGTGEELSLMATCSHCRHEEIFRFALPQPPPAPQGRDIDEILSGVEEPSRIVDLAQWLSLFYLLIESASAEQSRPAARRQGYRAALCMAEAMKFYGDDDLPPESAFFGKASATVYREHPERFSRQRLRDIQARLPALGMMASRLGQDNRRAGKRWWQFWRG